MSTRVRRNSSISKVWDTLKSAQKWAALRAAGVDKDRAGANAVSDWADLSPDLKGALLAGWNMSTVGGTTRRYKTGGTTRRVPVLTNPGDWRVTHDGQTVKGGLKSDGEAMNWLLRRQSQSVEWAIRYSGYDIVCVKGGKVVWSWKRDGMSKKNRSKRNPVPLWMQSEEIFHQVIGVSVKEWQRIFRALPEWKQKEFHRRAGKKILSANAMKWVVEQGQATVKANKAGSRGGKVWYAAMYKTGRGLAWWVSESKATLMRKPIVGNILKISAPTSSKAIQEAWKHVRRIGL